MTVILYVTAVILFFLIVGGYFLFRDTMNRFQSIGHLYWITRDDAHEKPTPWFTTKAFVRQTAPPWKRGNGWQVRVGKHTFQVGICDLGHPADDEIEGLMNVLGARDMHVSIDQIRGLTPPDSHVDPE
jgi:hypothetical protein